MIGSKVQENLQNVVDLDFFSREYVMKAYDYNCNLDEMRLMRFAILVFLISK